MNCMIVCPPCLRSCRNGTARSTHTRMNKYHHYTQAERIAIMMLLARDYSNKELMELFGISRNTITRDRDAIARAEFVVKDMDK